MKSKKSLITPDLLSINNMLTKDSEFKNQIIAIMGTNANIGSTWFSISLSHCLSISNHKCLYFDFSNSRIRSADWLNMYGGGKIELVLNGAIALNQAIAYNSNYKIDYITPNNNIDINKFSKQTIFDLFSNLNTISRRYKYTIIDLNYNNIPKILSIYSLFKTAIIIMPSSLQGLRNCYHKIRKMALLNPEIKINIVEAHDNKHMYEEYYIDMLKETIQNNLALTVNYLGRYSFSEEDNNNSFNILQEQQKLQQVKEICKRILSINK